MGKPIIEVQGIHKSFDGLRVLEGVDLTIEESETVVIIGCSGCGKSVLLKHIIGILKPDAGIIKVDGQNIVPLREYELNRVRRLFGMLFQGAALFDSMSVWDNVGFSLLEHTRMRRAEIDAKVKRCLALVGLEGLEDKRPAELSGGMRKRVGLARAIAGDPKILLFDEPTTGVDPVMGDVINDLIISLREKLSVTSVAVTHDIRSAYRIADRIAMLYEGRIIVQGTPHEIRTSPNPVVQQFVGGTAKGPMGTFGT